MFISNFINPKNILSAASFYFFEFLIAVFSSDLNQAIDLRHLLTDLSKHMHLQEIEASLARLFASQGHASKKFENLNLFDVAEEVSCAGPLTSAILDYSRTI